MVLPTKALQLVQRNIDDEERIKVSVGDNHVTFTCGDTKIYSKLIEGQFPNYERVIPLDNQLKMYVNKDLLISAVRRVSIFSNQYTSDKICAQPSSLMIQAEDVEVGGEAQESCPLITPVTNWKLATTPLICSISFGILNTKKYF